MQLAFFCVSFCIAFFEGSCCSPGQCLDNAPPLVPTLSWTFMMALGLLYVFYSQCLPKRLRGGQGTPRASPQLCFPMACLIVISDIIFFPVRKPLDSPGVAFRETQTNTINHSSEEESHHTVGILKKEGIPTLFQEPPALLVPGPHSRPPKPILRVGGYPPPPAPAFPPLSVWVAGGPLRPATPSSAGAAGLPRPSGSGGHSCGSASPAPPSCASTGGPSRCSRLRCGWGFGAYEHSVVFFCFSYLLKFSLMQVPRVCTHAFL